jgi:hypothetical protein
MATLSVNLKLTSTDISNNEVLSLDVSSPTDKLSVTDPFISLAQIAAGSAGGDSIIVPATSNIKYVYIKHTGVDASGSAVTALLKVESADSTHIIELGQDEFLFFPVKASQLIQLEAASGTIVAEYAYFTKV